MNKKVKIILGIVILLIIWGVIFIIDYNRCANLKEPIFVIEKSKNDTLSNQIYYGLGYKVEVNKDLKVNSLLDDIQTEIQYKTKIEELPKDYSFIQAIRDNCVISSNSHKIYNKDELDKFLENVNNNIPDFVRCISFSEEGDMLITDVNFEGNKSFRYCLDSTRDKWAGEEDRTYRYGNFRDLRIDESDEKFSIYLMEDVEGDLKGPYVIGYYKNYEIINDYEFNYLLEIQKSENIEKKKITVDELKNKYDYDIYYYGIDSAIIEIDNQKMDLIEALKNDKVTMEKIIEQAERDSKSIIVSDMYKEGGSMIYFYDSYTIIKRNSLDGDRDVYIGIPEMRLNDVEG